MVESNFARAVELLRLFRDLLLSHTKPLASDFGYVFRVHNRINLNKSDFLRFCCPLAILLAGCECDYLSKNSFLIIFAIVLFAGPGVLSIDAQRNSISNKISDQSKATSDQWFHTRGLNSGIDPQTVAHSDQLQRIPSTEKIPGEAARNETASPNQPPPADYDEQLGITFSQTFSSLAYNVTAIEQADSYGYGPAYLLNGLSDQGYWYQVGLSWNWPYTTGGYNPGFNLNYEVFNSTGQSVFPMSGGGGFVSYSGAVNEGDSVLLSLYFSNGQVIMYSQDWNTGATASENYSSEGSSTFAGLTGQTSNSNGFFTGLMTEEYQASAYYGSETEVKYSDPSVALTSGIMWADEYNVNTSQVLFNQASSQLTYSNPDQFQSFSSNGASETSDAYTFVTGAPIQVPITLSYSVEGGGSGYSTPTLSYISNGQVEEANLSLEASIYNMDSGSTWTVTNPLLGSNSSERWFTAQTTEESVTVAKNISFVYTNEFLVSVSPNPIAAGSSVPSGSNWYAAGSILNVTARSVGPYFFVGWNSTVSSSKLNFQNGSAATTAVSIDGSGDIFANFAKIGVMLSPDTGFVTQGATGSIIATVQGPLGAQTSLAVSGLPGNTTVTFDANPIFLYLAAVNDSMTISVPFSTPPGNYSLTVTATDTADGGNGSASYLLTVREAVALTFAYSTSDNGSAFSGPVLNFTYNGENESASIGTFQRVFYADLGTSWSIQNLLPGSNASERWITDQTTFGTATGPISLTFTYFDQYLVNFEYQIVGGGIPNSSPAVTFRSLGSGSSVEATPSGTEAWADALSPYSYDGTLVDNSSGSYPSQRWELSTNNSDFLVTSNITADPNYYHQFLVSTSFEVVGGGTGFTAPVLDYETVGSSENVSLSLNSQGLWIDSGSSWLAPTQINGSSSLERWVASSGPNLTGSVTSAGSLVLKYENQYFVTVDLGTPLAGSVHPSNGWYNSSQSITISAEANAGWQFASWEGNSTTSSPSFITRVIGPINETADYNAGVTINSGANGNLAFSYGSSHGLVAADTSKTVYVPLGTSITFHASPASLFYTVRSWSVANDSTSPSSPAYSMMVSSPSRIGVSFEYNLVILGIIFASSAAGVLSYVMLSFRKRQGPAPPPPSEASTEDPELALPAVFVVTR